MPVCDTDKHYWVAEAEVEKLLAKGKDWIEKHPARDMIVRRYLNNIHAMTNMALSVLLCNDEADPLTVLLPEAQPGSLPELLSAKTENDSISVDAEVAPGIHQLRLLAAKEALLQAGAKRIADLGCGEGKLLKLLIAERQFEYIIGMDVSTRALEIAADRLKTKRLAGEAAERIILIQGSLTYRDKRLAGLDAAALVEVIEHLDEPRLEALSMLKQFAVRSDQGLALTECYKGRAEDVEGFVAAYAHYCRPVNKLDDYKLAPFHIHILAAEGKTFTDQNHEWHLEEIGKICLADEAILLRTPCHITDLNSEESIAAATETGYK